MAGTGFGLGLRSDESEGKSRVDGAKILGCCSLQGRAPVGGNQEKSAVLVRNSLPERNNSLFVF